jgi:hypothetical protein
MSRRLPPIPVVFCITNRQGDEFNYYFELKTRLWHVPAVGEEVTIWQAVRRPRSGLMAVVQRIDNRVFPAVSQSTVVRLTVDLHVQALQSMLADGTGKTLVRKLAEHGFVAIHRPWKFPR